MEFSGSPWWPGFLLVISLAFTVGEVQVLRGKIEEPGWRLMWDPDSRAGNILLVVLSAAFTAFFAMAFVGTLVS